MKWSTPIWRTTHTEGHICPLQWSMDVLPTPTRISTHTSKSTWKSKPGSTAPFRLTSSGQVGMEPVLLGTESMQKFCKKVAGLLPVIAGFLALHRVFCSFLSQHSMRWAGWGASVLQRPLDRPKDVMQWILQIATVHSSACQLEEKNKPKKCC